MNLIMQNGFLRSNGRFTLFMIFLWLFSWELVFYYYTKAVGKDEDDDEKDEPNSEEKLIGAKKTTSTAINDEELD